MPNLYVDGDGETEMKKFLKEALIQIGLIGRKKGKTVFDLWNDNKDIAFLRIDFFPNGTGIVEIHSNHDEKFKLKLEDFLKEFKKTA